MMFKRLEAMAASIFFCAFLFAPPFSLGARAQTKSDTNSNLAVRALFINVGKADSILLMLGDQRYLVDTGTKENVDEILRALALYGVTSLDGIVITHLDSDHVGGLKPLLKEGLPVGQLYASAYYNTKSIDKHPVYKQSIKNDIPLHWLSSGDVIPITNGIQFTVLGPINHDEEKENNNSLVLRLETPQGAMILAGDMEVEEEQELYQAGLLQNAAVLKVGHHGAGDASSEVLVYNVKPQIAVISTDSTVAKDLPDPTVLGRLWNIGAEVLITQNATCGVLVTLQNGNAVGQLVDYTVQ